jgi:thioesterase domain-containing protein
MNRIPKDISSVANGGPTERPARWSLILSPDRDWSALVSDVRVEFVSGHHHSMVQSPGVEEIAGLL